MKKQSLFERMKGYEKASRVVLDGDLPIIVRIDGKAFSTYTRNLNQPFDQQFTDAMLYCMKSLCKQIQQVNFAYTQSDEITLVLSGYSNEKSEPWFGGKVEKIASVSASIATFYFNKYLSEVTELPAFFDARVFNLPSINEVVNMLIWRQNDAMRNSLNSYARHFFSHKQIHGKSIDQVKQLLKKHDKSWDGLNPVIKCGGCCIKKSFARAVNNPYNKKKENDDTKTVVERSEWVVDRNIPIFVKNKEYILGNIR